MIWSIFDSLLGQYRNRDNNILIFASVADFPAVGSTSYLYIAQYTWCVYRWNSITEQYVAISIEDNSSNWNTAYGRWNHADAWYALFTDIPTELSQLSDDSITDTLD